VIGLRPDDIRDMMPRDVWLCFAGWNEAHSPEKPGQNAMTADEYRELVRQVDGH
jgi:hypothetical protein